MLKCSILKCKAIRPDTRSGQSVIESCIAMGILCLILMGLFQLSRVILAKEILYHAAARCARARTVGLNDFMMHKVARVATLLTAGRMESPEIDGGPAAQRAIEQSRIPLYLGAEHSGQLYEILDYEDWDTFNYPSIAPFDNLIRVQISQSFPLRTAMHRAFYAADSVYLNGDAFIANHYDLYLDVE